MSEKATMPSALSDEYGLSSGQRSLLRHKRAILAAKGVCQICRERVVTDTSETRDGVITACCWKCKPVSRPPPPIPRRQSSPSAKPSPEEQTRIDRRIDLMKKRLRLTLLGVR
jgi:hypothetical protein